MYYAANMRIKKQQPSVREQVIIASIYVVAIILFIMFAEEILAGVFWVIWELSLFISHYI